MRIKILASSSKGNSALVEIGGKYFLIDAGMSFKRLEGCLMEEGITPAQIAAIFVTHEHSDHVSALSGFAALKTPVYATRGTAGGVTGRQAINWQLIPTCARFEVSGVRVESFAVPHDACDPVGYAFDDGAERLVWALDVGHLDAGIKKILQSATTLVLESNYCPKMLEADKKRPFYLKQRIKGRHGHLSNADTFTFLTTVRSPSWKKIYLAHLSPQCNNAEELEAMYAATGMPIEVIDPLLTGAQA